MKNIKVILLAFLLLFFSSVGVYARDLTVAAAANLQGVLDELIPVFEKQGGVKLKTIIASSGKLITQIENGAPFDVFLSADMKYPQTLYKEGLGLEEPKVYAYGVLVLLTARNMNLSKGVAILTDPTITKIAIANPQLAPYGREAVNVFKFYKLYQDIQKKLVYGESISQTNDFIVSQSADVGVTSKSTVLSPKLKDKGVWIEIPLESYQRIAQGCIILKHAQGNDLKEVQNFYDFLFSAPAKEIFKKYGYTVDE